MPSPCPHQRNCHRLRLRCGLGGRRYDVQAESVKDILLGGFEKPERQWSECWQRPPGTGSPRRHAGSVAEFQPMIVQHDAWLTEPCGLHLVPRRNPKADRHLTRLAFTTSAALGESIPLQGFSVFISLHLFFLDVAPEILAYPRGVHHVSYCLLWNLSVRKTCAPSHRWLPRVG